MVIPYWHTTSIEMARRKGMMGRKKTAFQPGNQLARAVDKKDGMPAPSNSEPKKGIMPLYQRLSKQEYTRTVSSPVKGDTSTLSLQNTMMLLRPNEERKGHIDGLAPQLALGSKINSGHLEVEGYRLVHMPTLVRAYHDAVMAHQHFDRTCNGILVALSEYEVKWGLGVSAVFGCTSCEFAGGLTPLFAEIKQHKPGRNPADVNVGFQLALHNTTISSTGARRFLSCLSLHGPSSSGLQKSANNFGPKMETENERDMADKRREVQDVLELRGAPRDTPIHAEYDRQYNNPLRSARGQTPFAPASQSRDVVIENVTPDKFIIGFHQTNKLCPSGNAQRCKGVKVDCPGHAGCTASLRPEQNIGDEESGGKACAGKLLSGENPITVGFLTTDADGKACKGFSSVMQEATKSPTENLLDQVHLSRSLRRALTNVRLAGDMFPANTVANKQKQQKRFAEDLSYRVQGEINACRQFHKHDTKKVEESMAKCVDSLLDCYGGSHSQCQKKSFLCRRGAIYRFPFLPRRVKGALPISGQNRRDIKRIIINSRVCGKRLWSTRFGTSTQKAEAVNSAFKMTNPKHSATFPRNGKFRDHSAIHIVNNGPGESIAMKMKAVGLEISRNSPCCSTLKQIQKVHEYDKARKRSAKYRARRARLRNHRYMIHDKSHDSAPTSTYRTDQLLHDHSYSNFAHEEMCRHDRGNEMSSESPARATCCVPCPGEGSNS